MQKRDVLMSAMLCMAIWLAGGTTLGWAADEEASETLIMDVSHVRGVIPREELPGRRIFPSTARFVRGDKQLSFVASRHNDEDSIVWLEHEVDRLDPQVVVIEGLPREKGIHPPSVYTVIDGMDPAEVRATHNEAWVGAMSALQRDGEFVGGEPTSREVLNAIVATTDFTENDFICFLLVRMIPQWQRTGADLEGGFEALFGRRMDNISRVLEIPREEMPDWPAVQQWFADGNGTPLDVMTFSANQIGHGRPDHDLMTKRIGYHVNLVRNQTIARVIGEMLQRHDRVLVVYGGSHYQYVAPALVDMLGDPIELAVPEWVLYPDDVRLVDESQKNP